MRKLIGFGAILGSVFAVWACSSSSPAPANNNDNDSGGSSSGGSSSGGADAAVGCSEQQIQASVGALLASRGVDAGAAGADASIPPCVMSACSTELDACKTEDCTTCEQSLTQCGFSCILGDASLTLPTADGSSDAKANCDAPGPDCTALGQCCSEITTLATLINMPTFTAYGTMCTTNATSCDEALCKSTAMSVNQFGSAFGQSMICATP